MADLAALVNAGTQAVGAYQAQALSLGGLVARLEAVGQALAEAGAGWDEAVDGGLRQLEIIHSLLASGDLAALTGQDRYDIDLFLWRVTDALSGLGAPPGAGRTTGG